MLSEITYTPKLTNIAELKDCFVHNMDDLQQGFIDIKVIIVSFHNRFRSCVAAAGRHSEHSI